MQRFTLLIFFFCSLLGYSQSYLDFYFKSKDLDGAILIYDENKDAWLFNVERDVKRKLPIGSLFNLQTTLIGLDLGIISKDESQIMAWDGVKRYYFGMPKPNWNCNTNLDEAIQNKTDWYFQNVSDLIPRRDLSFFIDKVKASNKNFNTKENYYWHFGGLTSTPEQQINFLRNLKGQKLLFRKENQQYLYDHLLIMKNDKFTLHGYETYNVYKGERIDWLVGVLKTNDNTYYFSTRIFEDVEKPISANFFNQKLIITLEVFRLMNYI